MDPVLQKIKADITSRPVVSTLIVVTVAAAATLLTLALATLMNLDAPYDKAFEELNGAHLWLYFDRDRVRRRDVERIAALPGITESTGLRYSVSNRVRIRDTRAWVSLRAIPLEAPAVNRLLVQAGRYLVPGEAELLASRDLDYLHELPVGDSVAVVRDDGKEIALPVVGLAYDPTWDIYRNTQPPYVYLSQDTLRELFPDESTWDWSIGLRLADPQGVDAMLARIEETLRPDAVESTTDWRDVKESAMFEVQLNFVFLGAFGLFAILAATLVVTSSVSASVLSQFRQIGILKAVGFTRGQVLALYLGQYLALGLAGSLLGLLLGIILSPLPLQSAAVSLSTTLRPPVDLPLVALVLAIVAAVVILASLGSAYKGARTNTIKAITTGAEAPRRDPVWVARWAGRLGLPIPLVLGLNDTFARPFRSLLTGLNLTLGVMGIVFGLALNETLDTYRSDPSLAGIIYDAVVARESTGHSKTRRLLSGAPGVAAFYGEVVAEVNTPAGASFQVRAVEGDMALFPLKVEEGRLLRSGTGEAIAGRGLLDWLGLQVGDEITVTFEDWETRPVTWRIVGQYPERSNAGQMLMVNLASVRRVLRHVEPRTYYLLLSPGADVAQLRRYLEPRPDADLSLSLVAQEVPDTIVYLQLAIFVLSGILISVAMINVFNTSLLAVQERLGVIGILKAVGMTPAQVVVMVATTAGFLGLLAALVGSPFGLTFTQGMLATLSRAYGFGGVDVSLNVSYVLLLIPAIVALSVVGSLIPGWWATRQSIVEVIRNE